MSYLISWNEDRKYSCIFLSYGVLPFTRRLQMILNLIAKAVGVERITYAEVVLGCALAVVFYFFLVIALSL